MRTMVSNRIGFSFCVIFLLSSIMLAQEPSSVKAPDEHSRGENPLAVVRWRTAGKEGHLLCVVTQEESGTVDALPTRTLTIYREEKSKRTYLFKYETPDSVLSVYPLGDYDARLVLTWVGGSAYHVQVLAFLDGQVKQVLNEGSKLPPELIYDERGRESILLTEAKIDGGKWTAKSGTTTVFQWSGRTYDKIGVAPWPKRLQCLTKESCALLR